MLLPGFAGLLLGLLSTGCASAAGEGDTNGEPPSDTTLVYVANQSAATVSVIDAADGALQVVDLRELGFGQNAAPHDVAVEPDGSFWYVSLIGADRVLKLDRSNELVASVEFERPGLLAMDPAGDGLWVGRSMAAVDPPQRIGRIDRSTMEVEEFEVFIPRPHALAVSPDGRWVFTASLAENTLVTLDTRSGEAELHRLDAPGPHGFVHYALSPDGGTLVVTAEQSDRLLAFDASGAPDLRLVAELQVADRPWHPAFSADGRFVWFGNLGADRVTVVRAGSWRVDGVIEGRGLAEPHGLAISADGERVFVSSRNERGSWSGRQDLGFDAPDGTLVIIDARTREIWSVVEIPPYGAGVATPLRP